MSLLKFSSITLFCTVLFSCSTPSPKTSSPANAPEYILWGSSFGHCRGYCFKETRFRPGTAETLQKGWDTVQYPTQLGLETIPADLWPKFVAAFAADSFFRSEERIGCPDCADGGAEWLEVRYLDKTHRVTFEYGSSPTGMERLLDALRRESL